MAHPIFNIPEILSLICKAIGGYYLPPLLTVSRRFFVCAIPYVWKRIWGPGKLRRLLFPHVQAEKIDSVWVNNIQPLDEQSLERFQLYAPYIKEVYNEPSHRYRDLSWYMVLRAVSARPLLPSLQSFWLSDDLQSTETAQIIDALVCPTLVSIRAPGLELGNGSFRFVFCPRTISRIAESCPSVSHLELYTRPLGNRSRGTYTAGPPPSPSLLPSLQQLHSLRTVGAGPEVLSSDALTMLGSLPNLESFTVFMPHDTPRQMIPDHFPPLTDSFVALRHFGLYNKSPAQASQLWKTLPFVRQLVSVSTRVDIVSTTNQAALRDLVCSICQFSPNATDLDLDFSSDFSEDNLENDSLNLFTPSVIAHLGRLPLQRMRVLVTLSAEISPPDDYEQLALALTNVEYLEIQECDFTYEGLEFIAKHMQRLQFLAISLDRSTWPFREELPLAPASSPSILCLSAPFTADLWFYPSDEAENNDYADSISTALRRLWPNGVRCEFNDLAGCNSTNLDDVALRRINDATQPLSSPNEFDALDMYSGSLTQWQYSNEHATSWLRGHRF